MRRESTKPATEESRGLFDRPKRKSAEPATDESRGLIERVRGTETAQSDAASQGWFDRARAKYGLGALLVAAGIGLVLFPEPATSAVGLVLLGVGALIWLVSRVR